MKKLVVLPTYNEIDNIGELYQAIRVLDHDLNILVVDDNSPDGTAQRVRDLSKSDPKINLLLRKEKQGLGKAYIAGFHWALEGGFDVITEMDADFSHRPKDLMKILDAIESQDVVVGSRYIAGGGTLNWGFIRKCISRGGSLYSRLILGYPIQDWTGGFNAWKADVLRNKMNLDQIESNGYSFQIELKYRALKAGCNVLEVPILFEERRKGQSKMSFKIVLEALYRVWKIRFLI